MSESDRLAAFDAVYQGEFNYVWATLRRLGVETADLPDLVHDVFVVVYRRWDELDPERAIRPWLFGIARKVAAAGRRKQRERGDAPDPAGPGFEERLADHELLVAALRRLEDERRDVFILHDLEGYSGQEIARMLEIPVNTVHSRLRLARKDLLETLAKLRGGRS